LFGLWGETLLRVDLLDDILQFDLGLVPFAFVFVAVGEFDGVGAFLVLRVGHLYIQIRISMVTFTLISAIPS
jgi:hypothetical protein